MAQRGFTVLEVLVAMTLSAIIGALVTKALMFHSDTYVQDVLRLRIQQNLRGALDIMSMNVRQAGEGLDKYFPAVTLTPGATATDTKLTMRRKTLSEVMTACQAVVLGSHKIFVSDVASPEPSCLPANIASGLTAWTTNRAAQGGTVAVYIYDRVGKTGEFVDYTGEGTSIEGNNFIQVTGPTHAYPIRSTSVYVLEEYQFSVNNTTNSLQLITNGQTDVPQDVAYKISQFHADLKMQDGTTLNSMAPADAKGWKDIRAVEITLSGQESWKTVTMNRSVKGAYFPRNVLSH